MLAGHVGAALGIGRAERRVNPAVFVFAALLLDVMLWSFALVGCESVEIPVDFAVTHQAVFVFPYSHGLLASIAWSVIAGALAFRAYASLPGGSARVAAWVAAAVFSHWLLDALVHRPELPLLGADSQKLGWGLWARMPIALGVESLISIAGLCWYLRGSYLSATRKVGLVTLGFGVLALTIAGTTVAPAPPSPTAMAASSLVTILAICGAVGWLARAPR